VLRWLGIKKTRNLRNRLSRECNMMNRFAIIVLVLSSVPIVDLYSTTNAVEPKQSPVNETPPGSVRAKPEIVEGEILVKYKEQFIKELGALERGEAIRELGRRLQKDFHVTPLTTHPTLGIQRLKLPPGQAVADAIKTLRESPIVEFVEPNYKIYPLLRSAPPSDKYWLEGPIPLWGMERIGMRAAWQQSGNVAEGITIAVIDSGIDYTHPDLVANRWVNNSEIAGDTIDNDNNGIIDDVHGANSCWRTDPRFDPAGETHPTGHPMDAYGHGTLVAGVIGAVVNNPSDGKTALINHSGYVAGVHRKAKLMALKIICEDGSGNVDYALEAIEYAYTHGASVMNASWFVASGIISGITGPSSGSAALRTAIEAAGSHKALFVAAAGNGSGQRNNDSIAIYPANYGADGVENVMAVAATMDACADGHPINFNEESPNYSKCDDGSSPSEALWDDGPPSGLGSHFGLHSVHIAAPGWYTFSTFPLSLDSRGVGAGTGTSLAAPHVAGCAALLQAMRATNPSLPPFLPRDLKQVLINNADAVPNLFGFITEKRRLDCHRALLTEIRDETHPSPPTGLSVK
jgi:serine protease